MKKQSNSGFPKQIAFQSKHTIVQFREDFITTLNEKQLRKAGIEAEPDLPDFTGKDLTQKLSGLQLSDITDRFYLTYGTQKNVVFVFSIRGGKHKFCMSKTPFNKLFGIKKTTDGFIDKEAKTMTYEDWLKEDEENKENEESEKDEENEKSKKKSKKSKESKKKVKNHDSSDTEMKDCTDNEENYNWDKDDKVDNSESGDEDDENTTPSIEQNVPGKGREPRRSEQSPGKTGSKKTGSKDRQERHTSPGISGDTPEPEPGRGGILLYAMESTCFDTTIQRGLLERDNSYVFERVHNCPPNLILPEQRGGMAPQVDDKFVSGLQQSDRENFEILGCTAKWHMRPGKQIIVILKFKKKNDLSQRLSDMRDDEGYKYKGPIVCKYKTFQRILKPGDEQILQNFLNETEFGKKADKEERAIDARGCTNAQLMKILEEVKRKVEKPKL